MLSAHQHPVFLVNSYGVVMFSEMREVFVNDVTKCGCALMIEVSIKCSAISYVGIS